MWRSKKRGSQPWFPFESSRKLLKCSIPKRYPKTNEIRISTISGSGTWPRYILFKSLKMILVCSQDWELLMWSKDERFPRGLEYDHQVRWGWGEKVGNNSDSSSKCILLFWQWKIIPDRAISTGSFFSGRALQKIPRLPWLQSKVGRMLTNRFLR